MNAITAPKSSALNRLEGYALIAMFQGFPIFAVTVLLPKLLGSHIIIAEKAGAPVFVAMATVFYALVTPFLARKFRMLRKGYEPLFFDASLSFGEKITRWCSQPTASRQLLKNVIMLSLLAVAVVSVG